MEQELIILTDWKAIAEEYITGDVAMRALAETHGVNFNTLRTRAVNGAWTEKRRDYRKKQDEEAAGQHSTDNIPPFSTSNMLANGEENPEAPMEPALYLAAEDIFNVSRQLLERARALLPRCGTMYEVRLGASAMKDLRELLLSHPVMDAEEQRARIEKVRADIEKTKPRKPEPLEVVFIGATEQASR